MREVIKGYAALGCGAPRFAKLRWNVPQFIDRLFREFDKGSVQELVKVGRDRWQIENQAFDV